MDPQLETALIQLAIRVGSQLLLDVFIPWVESLTQAKASVPDTLGMAREIVRGIDEDLPEWSSFQKKDHAVDSLSLWLRDKGVRLPERDINMAIELAVQSLQGEKQRASAASEAPRA